MARKRQADTRPIGPSDVERRTINEEVAGRFKRLREDAGLSQNEVAERSGIPQTVVSGWERGATMSVPNLLTICARFRWNPVYLILGQGDRLLTSDDLGQTASALSGQSQMLHEVEFAVQQAFQQVRRNLLARQGQGADAAAVRAVEAVPILPVRKRHGKRKP